MTDESQNQCCICKKPLVENEGLPTALITNSLLDFCKQNGYQFPENGLICKEDLKNIRSQFLEHLLQEEKGSISKMDEEVIQSIQEHEILTKSLKDKFNKKSSLGDRVAEKISNFGGSWLFICSFLVFIFVWMIINVIGLLDDFDPYPFILLNLVLSCLAAIQAPIIIMSQNRHQKKDLMRDEVEYEINLKAELEIRQLHKKIDEFTKYQWMRILEIQKMQLDILEEIDKKS